MTNGSPFIQDVAKFVDTPGAAVPFEISEIIVGGLLGDAGIFEKRKESKSAYFYLSQSGEHMEFVHYIWYELYRFGFAAAKVAKFHPRIQPWGATYYEVGAGSFLLKVFMGYRNEWYLPLVPGEKVRKKIVPANIGQFLTPKAMAIWYMGDGTLKGNKVRFCTNGFNRDCSELLVKIINEKYDLGAYTSATGTAGQYFVDLPASQMGKFVAIVKPFMLPIFMYKIGLSPDGLISLRKDTPVKAPDSVELLEIRYQASRAKYFTKDPSLDKPSSED